MAWQAADRIDYYLPDGLDNCFARCCNACRRLCPRGRQVPGRRTAAAHLGRPVHGPALVQARFVAAPRRRAVCWHQLQSLQVAGAVVVACRACVAVVGAELTLIGLRAQVQ